MYVSKLNLKVHFEIFIVVISYEEPSTISLVKTVSGDLSTDYDSDLLTLANNLNCHNDLL